MNNWNGGYSKEKQLNGWSSKNKKESSLFNINIEDFDFVDELTNPLDEFDLKTKLELKGTIDKQFYFAEDTGFGIYSFETDLGIVKIKGTFVSELMPGASYILSGYVTEYSKEKQLQVLSYKPITPYSKKGVTAYLATLKGLKKVRASNIYAVFGNDSINVLLNEPLKVANSVPGIGKKSVLSWQKQLQEQQDTEALMIELMGYGLTIKEIRKLFAKYGDSLSERIRENPYFLSFEVKGYGFKRCDSLAMNMNYKFDGIERIKSGILYAIEETCVSEGHTFLYNDQLLKYIDDILSIKLTESEIKKLINEQTNNDSIQLKKFNRFYTIEKQNLIGQQEFLLDKVSIDIIKDALVSLIEDKKIIIEDGRVYLYRLYHFELKVAKEAHRLHQIQTNNIVTKEEFIKYFESYLKKNKIKLEDKQYEAVISIAFGKGGMHMLNGSAGCGKTFVTKIIRHMIEWYYNKIKDKVDIGLFAPTGKAAKIASKAMGDTFLTIHKGLMYVPGEGFLFNKNNPFDHNVVFVDEFTMVDLELLSRFLDAVKDGTKVVFIGDYKQLPSVSPGNCFLDLLESDFINVVTLDVVKRQAGNSGLLKNANRIINGEMIQSEKEIGDSFFIPVNTNEKIVGLTIKSIERLMKKGFAFDDIQVLVPMRKTMIGANYLNYIFQNHFNPKKEKQTEFLAKEFVVNEQIFKLYFRKGDKVIHIKNDSELEWFDDNLQSLDIYGINNGECGTIIEVVREKEDGKIVEKILVKYEDGIVIYKNDFSCLEHAYALTIHKSQGSQWRAVILPFSNSFFPMFQNNLIYTAWTRAMEFATIIGQKYAIKKAINTFTTTKRNSYLKERILELKTN